MATRAASIWFDLIQHGSVDTKPYSPLEIVLPLKGGIAVLVEEGVGHDESPLFAHNGLQLSQGHRSC